MRKVSKRHFVERWSNPELRPKISGSLIDQNGCKCAQGDVLSQCGYSDDELRAMFQGKADAETARLLDISHTHAIFLRNVSDSGDGCPQDVLDTIDGGIERLLGPNAKLVLAFWRYLEAIPPDQWSVPQYAPWTSEWGTARNAARDAARTLVSDEILSSAWNAVRGVLQPTTWSATQNATVELIGLDKIESPYFLPIFGMTDPKSQLSQYAYD